MAMTKKQGKESHVAANHQNVKSFDPAGILADLECFTEVKAMVKAGEYTRHIVSFIHDNGELTHLSERALALRVQRYKDSILSPSKTGLSIIESKDADDDEEEEAKIDREDPASLGFALKDMFYDMYERIKMEVGTEKQLQKLFAGTHKEFIVAFTMAEKIMKMSEVNGEIFETSEPEREANTKVDNVMDNPESRHKVLGIIDLIMDNPGMLSKVASGGVSSQKRHRPKRKKKAKAQ